MPKSYFNHQAAHLAVRTCVEIKGQKPSYGTGFFYMAQLNMRDDPLTSKFKLLLISNRHVIPNENVKLTITLNRRKPDGSPDYGNINPITWDGLAGKYYGHPNRNVDLSCVDVSDIMHGSMYVRYIREEFLSPIDYERIGLGSQILYIGYPYGYYDAVNNLPLTRTGALASLPHVDFEGKGQLVIDAQVFPGSSGGPVFIDWDETYKLLGVISEWRPGPYKSGLGLGIVIKQQYVQELINYALVEFLKSPPNEYLQQLTSKPLADLVN